MASDHSPFTTHHSPLCIGLCAQIACIWEATACKPGNVHRYRDFADMRYVDLLLSAAAIAPWLETASERPVGETILQAVQATREVVTTNTNLGIILLLAPLAAVPRDKPLRSSLANVLDHLDRNDARLAYKAIRLASPGGLGRVAEQDVSGEPTLSLKEVMALAADRDLIARQYANGFREVFEEGVPVLFREWEQSGNIERAIITCHLSLMAAHPDSLIARKCGLAEAEEAARRAKGVLKADASEWEKSLADLDGWLTARGSNRNPGTTADLVAACLFVGLREGVLTRAIITQVDRRSQTSLPNGEPANEVSNSGEITFRFGL